MIIKNKIKLLLLITNEKLLKKLKEFNFNALTQKVICNILRNESIYCKYCF